MAEIIDDDLDEHSKERNFDVRRDGEIRINTEHKQKMSPSKFMDVFKSFVYDYRKQLNQLHNLKDEIQERRDEHGRDIEFLTLVDNYQDTEVELEEDYEVREEDLEDILDKDALIAYVEMQKFREQVEELEESLEDLKQDIKDMYPAARETVVKFDEAQMPKPVQVLDFLDSEEFFEDAEDQGEEPAKKEVNTEEEE